MADTVSHKMLTFLLLILLASSCNNKPVDQHAIHSEHKEPVYTCAMHPQIIRNAPGSCPICGMVLVKKEESAKKLADVELDAVLKPVNGFVISGIPITTAVKRTEQIDLNVLGTVAYDTREIRTIASRVSGRIEKLYVKYKFQPVSRGQKVMEIYSPELVTAQQNLIFLSKNDPDNFSLIKAAEDRLALLGFTRQQINYILSRKAPLYAVAVYSNYSGYANELSSINNVTDDMNSVPSTGQELNIKEGMYLQTGQPAFSVYNPDRVWILLNLFPEQQASIKVGNRVQIAPETAPGKTLPGTVNYIEPVFRQGSKSLTARVYFNNRSLRLPIGSRVRATIIGNSRNAFWLPKEAVLSLGREKIVFVKQEGGFKAKKILTGVELAHFIELRKGILFTDSIAANAQYLMDNESFIQLK
jgi:membrane fusion protein, copper/silver efflux system